MDRCRLIRDFATETSLLPYALRADAKSINDNFVAHMLHDCTPVPSAVTALTTGIAKPHRDLLRSLSRLADYVHEARVWMDRKQPPPGDAPCCNPVVDPASASCAGLVRYIHAEFMCFVASANRMAASDDVEKKTRAVCRTVLRYLTRDRERMERATRAVKDFNDARLTEADRRRIADLRRARGGRLANIIRACKNVAQISREVERFVAGGGGSVDWLAVALETFAENIKGLVASCATGGWMGRDYQRNVRSLIDRVAAVRRQLNARFPGDAECCFDGPVPEGVLWTDCRVLLARLRDEVNCTVSAVLEDTRRTLDTNYLSVVSTLLSAVNDSLGRLRPPS